MTGHAVGGEVSVVITVAVPHVVDGSTVVSPVDVPVVVMVIVSSVQVVTMIVSVPHEVAGGIVVVPGGDPEVVMVVVVSEQGVIGAEVVVVVVVVVDVVVGLEVVVVVVEQEVVVVEVVEQEVEVELGQSELQPGPPPAEAAGLCTETGASCAWAELRPCARAARPPQATRLWRPNVFMPGTIIDFFWTY